MINTSNMPLEDVADFILDYIKKIREADPLLRLPQVAAVFVQQGTGGLSLFGLIRKPARRGQT